MSSIPRKLKYINVITAFLKDMRTERYKVNKPGKSEGLKNFLSSHPWLTVTSKFSQIIIGAKNQKLGKF